MRGDDREAEDELFETDDPAEDDGTAEPSLGSVVILDQTQWAQGNRRDLEHDDETIFGDFGPEAA